MDAGALVVQALLVNFIVVRSRPQADAAADEVLVGVQKQVQQMLVGRHGEKAGDLGGRECSKKRFSSSCASSEESNRRRCISTYSILSVSLYVTSSS